VKQGSFKLSKKTSGFAVNEESKFTEIKGKISESDEASDWNS
tara:strand:+ start:388 stop:513 length:126 start_codon:yes stop_codon:yes gene_type:complete